MSLRIQDSLIAARVGSVEPRLGAFPVQWIEHLLHGDYEVLAITEVATELAEAAG